MTVRGLLLALAVLASAPVPAAAGCHRYSVWHYPWPQRCGVRHQAAFVALAHHRPSRPVTPVKLPNFGIDIPLPALAKADCLGGEADENSRARLMLRAALENAYGH